PMVLKTMLRAKIRVIQGYAGTRDINLAMQRGEVHGTCGLFGSSIKSSFAEDVKVGRLKIVIQMGNKKSDEFGAVPSVFDYARTDEERAVLDVGPGIIEHARQDRKSTRLNSSHSQISYAVFCLKKKKKNTTHHKTDNEKLNTNV